MCPRSSRQAELEDLAAADLGVQDREATQGQLRVDRVYALARGSIVLEARADEANLPNRLERAYFGEGAHAPLDA